MFLQIKHFVHINLYIETHMMLLWIETDNVKINSMVHQMVINLWGKKGGQGYRVLGRWKGV